LPRAPSKNFGKTIQISDLMQRKRSPEDKENTISVKSRKPFGVKIFASPGSRKPFNEITNERRSVKIGLIIKNNLENMSGENPEELEKNHWKTP
jgi:hypothetical protein